jgi:hypothetical protein
MEVAVAVARPTAVGPGVSTVDGPGNAGQIHPRAATSPTAMRIRQEHKTIAAATMDQSRFEAMGFSTRRRF